MATRKTAKSTVSKPLARTRALARRKMAPPSPVSILPWRTITVVIGVAGLAALASALLGSRRFREIARPLSAAALLPLASAVAPQADRVWAETRPWRDHVGRLLASINTEEVREAVAERLSHWMERFR